MTFLLASKTVDFGRASNAIRGGAGDILAVITFGHKNGNMFLNQPLLYIGGGKLGHLKMVRSEPVSV